MKNAILKMSERRWRRVLLFGFTAILVGGFAEAQVSNWKLNPPLVDGDVRTYRISADGKWVVYQAALHTPDAYELYSVSIDGGPSVRLNGALPSGTDVEPLWEITPDSSRVIFVAPQENIDVRELFSVPIEGPASAAIKLNKTLPTGGDVGAVKLNRSAFTVSPDGARVVYMADQDVDNTYELYSVPVGGPAEAGVKLNPPLVAGGDVNLPNTGGGLSAQISADGQWVVYYADQVTDGVHELFSVPIDGPSTAVVKLNGPIVPGGRLNTGAQISPDSSRVVYKGSQLQLGVYELFSVPIRGPSSAGVKLNATLPANGAVGSYLISSDSSRVVYTADQDVAGTDELYSINITGPSGSGVKINRPLIANWEVKLPRLTSDGQRVVYSAGVGFDDTECLYSVPITGPANDAVQLTGLTVNLVDLWSFAISPDDRWVVYRGREGASTTEILFSVRIEGGIGTNEKLSKEGLLYGGVQGSVIAPDSGGVAYTQTRGLVPSSERDHLYYVPIRGPALSSTGLSGAIVTDGDVIGFLFSPEGDRVVYRADQDTDEVFELYASTAPLAAAERWDGYR